jgi:hypothetical protein
LFVDWVLSFSSIQFHLIPNCVSTLNLLGTLAAKYEKLGGEVKWMGKPGEVMKPFLCDINPL